MLQAADLQKQSARLRQRLDLSLTSTWRSFQDLVACLVATNALEADTLRPLPLGNIARQIHGENELWLAMMLCNPAVQASYGCIVHFAISEPLAQCNCLQWQTA